MMPENEDVVEQDHSPVVQGDQVWWTYGVQGMNQGIVVGFTDDTKMIAVIKRGAGGMGFHVQVPADALTKLVLKR